MKSMIVAFATLFLLSHGLHVADRTDPDQQEQRLQSKSDKPYLSKGKGGVLTYETMTGWTWLGPASAWLRSVINPEMAEGETLVMRAHHRSGIQLAKSVSDCVAEHANPDKIARVMLFPEKVDGDYTDITLAASKHPTIHLVREVDDWVTSWYHFSKSLKNNTWKSTRWMRQRSSMMHTHGGDELLRKWMKAQHNVTIVPFESIVEFLNRVPAPVGLAVAYTEFTRNVLPQAQSFASNCKPNDKCKQVCLAAFKSTESSYMSKWEEVFKFAGEDLAQNEGLQKCVKEQRKADGVAYYEGQTADKVVLQKVDKQFGGALAQAKKSITC